MTTTPTTETMTALNRAIELTEYLSTFECRRSALGAHLYALENPDKDLRMFEVLELAERAVEMAGNVSTWLRHIATTLTAFCDGPWSDSSIGESLTCTEANYLAHVVSLVEGHDALIAVLHGHAGQDDCGDEHFLMRSPDDIEDDEWEAFAEDLHENRWLALSYWGEDEDYPARDWATEAVNGDTRLGYWDWVAGQKELANA